MNHSPPSSAEITNEWSYTLVRLICVYSVDRDNFPFYVTITIVTIRRKQATITLVIDQLNAQILVL